MVDALTGAVAVLMSLAVSLGLMWLTWRAPVETRGMVGLLATVLHLLLSLALPALAYIFRQPLQPLVFVASVLVFYWLSLIILVVTIIRWLRAPSARPASVDPGN